MNLLIRADSSSTIGLGHIMRDLVLAQHYPHATITFACQDLAGNIMAQIPYSVHILASNTPEELIELIQDKKINRVIFDHYGIDHLFEKKVKESTDVTIVSLDDTYQKHCCDILINPNIYAQEERYKELVPNRTIIRCGKEFLLIREEFHIAVQKSKLPTNAILVAMGGSDPLNLSMEVIAALPATQPIHLITTTANPHLDQLQVYIQLHPHITLHINTPDMATLMHQCALAIITPSSIAHEVMFMELPFIAIQSAENQREFVAYMKREHLSILPHFEKEPFLALLGKWL